MYTNSYTLVDNENKIRVTKHHIGLVQGAFNDIKSTEKITYPWKVVSSIAKDTLVLDECTTQKEWNDFSSYCEQLL